MNRSSQSRRSERSGSLFRAFSSYLRSASASSVVSTVRSAGASVASSILPSDEDDRNREQVQWAGFDKLELGRGNIRHVLLLAYTNGFQVWDIEDADDVHEIVSKRDAPVAFLKIQPRPITLDTEDSKFKDVLPLLLVVTSDATVTEGGYAKSGGSLPQPGSSSFVPTVVRFYSLRNHTYVDELRFRSAIYSVRCSPRIIAVALETQICCFDAATLGNSFSVLTYPIPQGAQGPGCVNIGYGPMDVGPRWLAYAANHALVSNNGRASPQSLSLSTSPLNGNLVAHYAKESSKQIAAGIVTLGDMGYKTLTKYCSELLTDGGSSPGSGSPHWKNNTNALVGHAYEPEHAGMVIVKDYVTKAVIAQFRAHKSPLSVLCFDPSGTLLVTASVHGHNLNVFRIMPSPLGNSSSSMLFNVHASHVHLYKLHRGLTNAVIQDISFSDDSRSIAISSSRGTSHLFAISPFGGVVGRRTHEGALVNVSMGSSLAQGSTRYWWSSSRLLKYDPQFPPPPPITLCDVHKIKNGNDGWCSTISGAAAAATGRSNISSGAVAAVFHNGGGQNFQSQLGYSDIRNQLWVFCPSGHVIRYALCPYAATDALHCSNSPEIGASSCGASQAEDSSGFVEPLQKWDLGRKSNWVERENNIDRLSGRRVEKENTAALTGYGGGEILAHSGDNEQLEKEMIITEEKRRWYLSNAEVHMHQERPPIWTKPEMYFHVILSETSEEERNVKGGHDGEVEIEKFPTRVIEARRKDLVPVFDHLKKQVNLERNIVPDRFPDTPNLQINQLRHSTGNEMLGINVECAKIDNSNSGFSRGSESCISDMLVQTTDLQNLNSHHAFEHHIQGPASKESEDIFGSSRSLKLINHFSIGSLSSQLTKYPTIESPHLTNYPTIDTIESPHLTNYPMNELPHVDIPRGGRGDACKVQALEDFIVMDGDSKILSMHGYGFGKQDSIKCDSGDSGVTYEEHVSGLVSQAAPNGSQTLCSDDNSDSFGSNPWDGGAEGETISPSSVLQSTSISKQHLHEIHMLQGNLKFQLQDEYVTVKDARSADSHNKDCISTGGENGEDALEGAMFPLCEED